MNQDSFQMLVALNLDERGDSVLEHATRFARPLQAVIHILHVAPPEPSDFVSYRVGPESVRESVGRQLRGEHRSVQALREKLAASGFSVGPALMVQGEVPEAIIAEARRLKPDLLVLGQTHHDRLFSFLRRSPAEYAIQNLPCPVLVIPTL